MKRVLILASVASMIDQFNMPNIELLQSMGYSVDVACNFIEGNPSSDARISEFRKKLHSMKVDCYQIDFDREITNIFGHIKALRQVEHLMKTVGYTFVHCHTPIGGVVGRLAGRMTGTKVIYTAHGFHFYKGSPKKNWLIYYPVERICSYLTDILITINREDYILAKNKMSAKRVIYVPGVGIDISRFSKCIDDSFEDSEKKTERDIIRDELGVEKEEVLILSVGELITRKNHETIIKALAEIREESEKKGQEKIIKYFIVGNGKLEYYLQDLIDRNGLTCQVKLLGYRSDVDRLLKAADFFAFPSLQEGLPVALMEAMASGTTCIVSKIRGNVDLINQKCGFLFDLQAKDEVKKTIYSILELTDEKKDIIKRNCLKKIQRFDVNQVMKKMETIYKEI